MIGWHHRLNGCEFEQTEVDSEGQGSLVCCSPWGCKESDTTLRLNNKNAQDNPHTKEISISVVPWVGHYGLCLAFLSLIWQTLVSSSNPPALFHPQAYPPNSSSTPHIFHVITDPCLTCEQQHHGQGNKVWVPGQVVRHVLREGSL